MVTRLTALLVAMCLGGCACLPRLSSYDYCATAKPIYVSKQDVLTGGTADQIRAHDETGAKYCGWK